jgi:hypothetical protein
LSAAALDVSLAVVRFFRRVHGNAPACVYAQEDAVMYAVFAQQQQDGSLLAGLLGALLGVGIGLIVLVALWRVFTKAGRPGWAALIPIYNVVVLLEIAGRPWWWLVLLFIPIVNLVVSVVYAIDLAKSFGRGVGFGLGLAFLSGIFFMILGFGSARYRGPAARQTELYYRSV